MLKIATSGRHLYFNPCVSKTLGPSQHCPYPGINAELLSITLARAKIQYELSNSANRHANSFKSVQSALRAGFSHMSTTKWIVTGSRMNSFDYSYPVEHVKPIFIVARSHANFFSNAATAVRNFDLELWMAVLATFVCFVTALYTFRRASPVRSEQNNVSWISGS